MSIRSNRAAVSNITIEKIETDIYVNLSLRRRALYRALLANVSVADVLEKIGDAHSARSLMNLVMQFRNVNGFDPFATAVSSRK